jgi:hypothetical protein
VTDFTSDEGENLQRGAREDGGGLKIPAACDETYIAQTGLREFAESAEKLAKIPLHPLRPPENGLSGLGAALLALGSLR